MKKFTAISFASIAIFASLIPLLRPVEAREIIHNLTSKTEPSVEIQSAYNDNRVVLILNTSQIEDEPHTYRLKQETERPTSSDPNPEEVELSSNAEIDETEDLKKTATGIESSNVAETITKVIPVPQKTIEFPIENKPPINKSFIEEPILDDYLKAVLLEIHRLTNKEREDAGLPALEYDPALAAVATGHSKDMAENDYFSHDSLDGCDSGCRLRDSGYVALAWGENLAWITFFEETTPEELAAEFVESWMDSEGHRHNILNDEFTHEGIGIARVNDKIYVTSEFSYPW